MIYSVPSIILGFSINGEVKIVDDQLLEAEKMEINDLKGKLEKYFQSALYSNDDIIIDYRLELNLKPKMIKNSFSVIMQLYDDNHRIQYMDKKINIYYDKYEILMFNEYQFHSMTSIFDFYFYMMIGEIADTKKKLGGDEYFRKAKKIADDGMMQSDYYGWDRRSRRIDLFLSPEMVPFRKAKSNIHSGFIAAKNGDMEVSRQNFLAGLELIKKTLLDVREKDEVYDYLNRVYFDMSNLFKDSDNMEVIDTLMVIDTLHTEYYKNLRQ